MDPYIIGYFHPTEEMIEEEVEEVEEEEMTEEAGSGAVDGLGTATTETTIKVVAVADETTIATIVARPISPTSS